MTRLVSWAALAALGLAGAASAQEILILAEDVPAGIPGEAAEVARDTLGGALTVAEQLPAELGAALLETARAAFTSGLQLAFATAAALIRDRGGQPAAPEASYDTPFPVTDGSSALRLAVRLEEGAAEAWHYVLGATSDPAVRQAAVAALSDAAVRATRWRVRVTPGNAAVAFPGR